MARCGGSKPDGSPCERIVIASQRYCYGHDPARSEARRRAASKAGRAKPSRELRDIKRQLQSLTDDVLAGEVDRSDASVAGQLLNILLRAIETERRLKESDEFEERLEVLENALGSHNAGGGRHLGR